VGRRRHSLLEERRVIEKKGKEAAWGTKSKKEQET